MDDRRMILALGGGGFQMTPDDLRLDDRILDIVRERSGLDRPRVCLIPTATGDDGEVIASFETLFADRAETSVLRLFGRPDGDLRALVLGQDAVYVLGGSTANLLASGGSTASRRSSARRGRRAWPGCRPGRSAGSRPARPIRSVPSSGR